METDSLLPKHPAQGTRTAFFSPIRRVLFVALVSAASFAFTQTSLIYAFRVMTCDDYYNHDLDHLLSYPHSAGNGVESGFEEGNGDRCSIPAIEGRTARSIAIMSTMTTSCCTFFSSSFFSVYLPTCMTYITEPSSLIHNYYSPLLPLAPRINDRANKQQS